MSDPHPTAADALARAVAAHRSGDLSGAERLYQAVLTVEPDHGRALHLLGMVLAQQGRHAEADPLLHRAAAAEPNSAEIQAHRGIVLEALGRHGDAAESYARALRLKPDDAQTIRNNAAVLLRLGRYGDALAHYDRALTLDPDHCDALSNRALALNHLGRPDEALESCDRALSLKPDHVDALNNRGNALVGLRRDEDALAFYDKVLALKPDHAEAHNNRGNTLLSLKRHDAALASYDAALLVRPDYADALSNRGNALLDLKQYEDAARTFRQLLSIAPDYGYAQGNLLEAQLHGCDWRDYAESAARIEAAVAVGKRAAKPFSFLAFSDSPRLQLQCARIFVADRYPPSAQPVWQDERYAHDKIRIAYLSADFHEHATMHLMISLFEMHDKARFETTAVSFGPDATDSMRARVVSAFDRFIDVRGMSDRAAAETLRALEIDIAIDLKGFTGDSRTGILAHRPCPLQLAYLGYPGTMGADYVDYFLADELVIPAQDRMQYVERIVTLPDTYQVNDSKRPMAAHTPSRAEAGLPHSGFVFCAFNGHYKITPPMFDVWMRLLRGVEGSVLWLLAGNDRSTRSLRHEAVARGIAPERLIFAPRLGQARHLARHRLADLFLDTLPINAHTTASDALWSGVPILTCLGGTFAGRVAGSLLAAIGLPELIAPTLEAYEATALALAQNPAELVALKAKLARHRAVGPLFDTDRFRRHIESAYVTMWERQGRGQPPADFAVTPID